MNVGIAEMESIVIERRITKWKNLKQRLGFKSMAMGCCGATWNPTTISILDQHDQTPPTPRSFNALNSATVPLLLGRQQQQQQQLQRQPVPTATGMNLAMALAAERNLRGNNNDNDSNAGPSPRDQVKTLMRLIEETEGVDWTQQQQQQQQKKKKKKQRSEENDDVEIEGGAEPEPEGRCCVCMERKKGAAFIPCGHTFCRVCSREVWLNRGSCPVCNRSILDILDIF
ncbi:hypothetical protein V6N13_147105 [Hibiscus sabdariffa]|uniref:RING-type domain-containing protein n=1 Tax=Hibiscus sabdariffa TaxID=183260 RepID=A0ABR2TUH0_9ROSI